MKIELNCTIGGIKIREGDVLAIVCSAALPSVCFHGWFNFLWLKKESKASKTFLTLKTKWYQTGTAAIRHCVFVIQLKVVDIPVLRLMKLKHVCSRVRMSIRRLNNPTHFYTYTIINVVSRYQRDAESSGLLMTEFLSHTTTPFAHTTNMCRRAHLIHFIRYWTETMGI